MTTTTTTTTTTTATGTDPIDPSPRDRNPTDPNRPAAARLDLKPDRAERCPNPCRLQARCRLDRPNGQGCPAGRRPSENGRVETVLPTPLPTPSRPAPGPSSRTRRPQEPPRNGPGRRTAQPPRSHRRPRPHEDEWAPGRMEAVPKPSWGGKFASKLRGESGMSTAEYAVGTLAAVAFAGALLKVLTSDAVQGALSGLVERALS